ncbi:MAG: NUDIX domain-containing protein [Planctomycetota bacterium]
MDASQSNAGRIEVIARGLIIRGGRVLVCRSIEGGYVYLPGGHVEPGEMAEVALARELVEEAGLPTEPGKCILIAEVVFGDPLRGGGHELNLVFHVEPPSTEESIASREQAIAFEWLDLAAVVDTDLRPRAIKAWLLDGADSGRSGPAFVSDREPS